MPLSDNLISYWSLDEASGNAIDAHGSNDLTEGGTVASATGKVNGGRDFERGDAADQFSIADNADLSTGDIDFSCAFWWKPESTGTTQTLVGKTDGAFAFQYEWMVRQNDFPVSFDFLISTGAAETIRSSSTTLSTGNWYFIVIWHDATNNEIGISINDGTPDTTAYSSGSWDSTVSFRMGNDNQGRFADGILDEVGFWKRVLSASEITELYNSGTGRDYAYVSGGGGGGLVNLLRGKTRGGLLLGGKL